MCFDELIGIDATLLQKAMKSANFQLSMHWYDASAIPATHYDMAPPLTCDYESQSLECLLTFQSAYSRQPRHIRPQTWSSMIAPLE
jgi:hypothetical protein